MANPKVTITMENGGVITDSRQADSSRSCSYWMNLQTIWTCRIRSVYST